MFADGVPLFRRQQHKMGKIRSSAPPDNRCPVHRRFDPLWNSLVVGGLDEAGKPFLGTIGMIGTAYSDDHVATGAHCMSTVRMDL